MRRLQSPYHLLPLSVLAMAAVFLISFNPSPATADSDSFERTDQTTEYTYGLVVVLSVQSADFASLLNRTNLFSFGNTDNGLDRFVDVASTTKASEGANAPFTRPQFAGSGIKEKGSDWSVSLIYTKSEYHVTNTRSPDYRQRVFTRCTRPQAETA